jgi:hypothetical protein
MSLPINEASRTMATPNSVLHPSLSPHRTGRMPLLPARAQWSRIANGGRPARRLDLHRLDRTSLRLAHLLDHLVGEGEKLPPAPRAIGRAKLFRTIVTFSRGRRRESAWSSRCNLLRVSSE